METFFQSTACQKVPLLPTAKVRLEIEVLSQELPEPQLSSLVTLMTEERLELDFLQEPERLLSEAAEPWLVSPLVDKEPTSHSSRPTDPTTRLEERERTGQELEVSQ